MPPRTRAATPSDEKITIRKAGVTPAKAHTRLYNDSEWVLGVLVTGQQRDVVSVAGGLGRALKAMRVGNWTRSQTGRLLSWSKRLMGRKILKSAAGKRINRWVFGRANLQLGRNTSIF